MGDTVAVKVDNQEYKARIDHLETTTLQGLVGYIIFIERPHRPPKVYAPILKRTDDRKGLLTIGHDYRGNPVTIDVNPLFTHLLQVGMTQQGKTHSMIVLLEEMAKHGIPCIVFDTQGEFMNMPQVFKNCIVLENIAVKDLIARLQQRQIVIINLLGLSNADKAEKLSTILHPFIIEKERDYADAENRFELLKIPPTLIFVDEAEIFCPKTGVRPRWAHRSALACEEIAKRGSKLGMGIIVATQRIINLSIDVRDNCSSIMAFRVSGRSNRYTLGQMTLFSVGTLTRLKAMLKGECIVLGEVIGGGAQTVKIRDIVTPRAKNVNFEQLLGLESRHNVDIKAESVIKVTADGTVVDTGTGEVLMTPKRKTQLDDKAAYDADEGDGVLVRTTPLSDAAAEEMAGKLPFDTHLTEEDKDLVKQLRKLNKDNDT